MSWLIIYRTIFIYYYVTVHLKIINLIIQIPLNLLSSNIIALTYIVKDYKLESERGYNKLKLILFFS